MRGDVAGAGVHRVEGMVGAEHPYPDERHPAYGHVLQFVQCFLVCVTV
jgi:hypothetical protein